MKILIQHDGVQQGPYSPEAARSLLREGSLLPSDPARYEDVAEWTPLETLLGITNGIVPGGRTSALAIWSLVLGTLGFLGLLGFPVIVGFLGILGFSGLAGFLGIPGIISLGISSFAAIICGHLSRRKIRKSGGLLTGKGIAMAGLILGYPVLILIAGGFAAGDAAITKAKKTIALATAVGIESAASNFYLEYGKMPSETEITDTSMDVSLVKTLLGDDIGRNPKAIRFLTVKEGGNNRNGLDPNTFKIFDPWGHGYQVILDTRYAEEVVVTRGGVKETLKGRRAAVFSVGKDGVAGTADDVVTW